jgi:hypothetical protein
MKKSKIRFFRNSVVLLALLLFFRARGLVAYANVAGILALLFIITYTSYKLTISSNLKYLSIFL